MLYVNFYLHPSLEKWALCHAQITTLSLIPVSHLLHLFQGGVGEKTFSSTLSPQYLHANTCY